jgi:hypothetical protein
MKIDENNKEIIGENLKSSAIVYEKNAKKIIIEHS